ncbi:hypothetical protein B0H21DRAFT_432134, partial [Amylocystis lapponica]
RCHIDKAAFFELYNRYYVTDVDDIVKFVKVTHSSKDLSKNANELVRILRCDDLDIYPETEPRPDFSGHDPWAASRIATLPFASAEILTDTPYITMGHYEPVSHNSIHDVEALFWATQYLCLTCDGPGGSRRHELLGDNVGGAPESLERIVFCFFECTTNVLANNRQRLFSDKKALESIIMPQFHPYFDSLKPLMAEWWRLLRMAYTFPPTPAMHRQVIAAIEKTLREIEGTLPSTLHAATEAELARRKGDLARAQEFRLWAQQSLTTGSPAL